MSNELRNSEETSAVEPPSAADLGKLLEQNLQLGKQCAQFSKQNAGLTAELADLKQRYLEVDQLNAWFRRQLFGKKSEKYLGFDSKSGLQLALLDLPGTVLPETVGAADTAAVEAGPPEVKDSQSPQRGTKRRPEGTVTAEGLRFSSDVPLKEEIIIDSAIEGLPSDEWEAIGYETTHKLAQQKSYFVKVLKRRKYAVTRKQQVGAIENGSPEQGEATNTLVTTELNATQAVVLAAVAPEEASAPAVAAAGALAALPLLVPGERVLVTAALPAAVLPNCLADLSFLVGLVLDKFEYHLPLHRVYLRLQEAGIEISRTNLTNWVHQLGDLLYPVWGELAKYVLRALVLTMDETPVRTRMEDSGTMKDGWFWAVYGEREFVFHFASSREHRWVAELLGDYKGVLLSDGFGAYQQHCASVEGLVQAACWSHARRMFEKAKKPELKLAAQAAAYFRDLYRFEREIREQKLVGLTKQEYRLKHSKPVVDAFFVWLAQQEQNFALLPKNPLAKAVAYASKRREALSVFLTNPEVPIDTNHLERENRKKAIGQHNWLFNWTEQGAQHMATFYSLLGSCKLNGVDPREYLTDVLTRVATVPGTKFSDLIPCIWKDKFSKAALNAQAATTSSAPRAA